MRNVWLKRCTENQNAHFMLILFFRIVPFIRKSGKISYLRAGQRRQYGACALHAGYRRLQTHTHGMCNIIAFPLQQSLHERATMSRCTYITSLVSNEIWSFLSQSESHILTKNCSYIHIRWVRNRSKSNGISSCLIHPMSFILAHQ